MALLAVKEVVQGRISMEDFSQYLVAGIQNCQLLKCYLLSFSLSIHVPNYYFLFHILVLLPELFALPSTLSSSWCGRARLSLSLFTLLCLIKISQRNSIFRLLPLMELLRQNIINQLLPNCVYLIYALFWDCSDSTPYVCLVTCFSVYFFQLLVYLSPFFSCIGSFQHKVCTIPLGFSPLPILMVTVPLSWYVAFLSCFSVVIFIKIS